MPDTKIKFADLPQHDILFHVSMTLGLVLVRGVRAGRNQDRGSLD